MSAFDPKDITAIGVNHRPTSLGSARSASGRPARDARRATGDRTFIGGRRSQAVVAAQRILKSAIACSRVAE
jgi:hypothetical protein